MQKKEEEEVRIESIMFHNNSTPASGHCGLRTGTDVAVK